MTLSTFECDNSLILNFFAQKHIQDSDTDKFVKNEIKILKEKPQTFGEQAQKFWTEISGETYFFNRSKRKSSW